MKIKKYQKELILYIIIFLFLMSISYLMPLTHDDAVYSVRRDYLWGLRKYNGRYIANLLTIPLCSNLVLRMTYKSVMILGIVLMIRKLFSIKSLAVNLILILLILVPGKPIYADTYTWTAAFGGYVPPVLLLLISIVLLNKISNNPSKKYNSLMITVLFVVNILMQLFAENSSVVHLFIYGCIVIYSLYKKKNVPELWIASMGLLIGSIIMFCGPMVLKTADLSDDAYFGIAFLHPTTLIKFVIGNLYTIIYKFSECWILWLMISIPLIILQSQKSQGISIREKLYIVILIAWPVWGLGTNLMFEDWIIPNSLLRNTILMFLGMVYIVTVGIVLYNLFGSTKELHLFVLGIISLIPLLFVSPIGGRTFYLTYVIWTCATVCLNDKLNLKGGLLEKNSVIIASFLGMVMLSLVMQFCNIHYGVIVRDQYVQEQISKGNYNIIVPYLPDNGWAIPDGSGSFEMHYNNSEESAHDIKVELVDWNTWYNQRKND